MRVDEQCLHINCKLICSSLLLDLELTQAFLVRCFSPNSNIMNCCD
jgi:hypothetical protein